MDFNQKMLEVCRLFRIEYEYLGYETIQMGNVNRTYKVNFLLPEGKPKSFLVQNVNTYAFRNPVGLMENIDKVTEHIRRKKPGQPKFRLLMAISASPARSRSSSRRDRR